MQLKRFPDPRIAAPLEGVLETVPDTLLQPTSYEPFVPHHNQFFSGFEWG
jgi:hypothetical protein